MQYGHHPSYTGVRKVAKFVFDITSTENWRSEGDWEGGRMYVDIISGTLTRHGWTYFQYYYDTNMKTEASQSIWGLKSENDYNRTRRVLSSSRDRWTVFRSWLRGLRFQTAFTDRPPVKLYYNCFFLFFHFFFNCNSWQLLVMMMLKTYLHDFYILSNLPVLLFQSWFRSYCIFHPITIHFITSTAAFSDVFVMCVFSMADFFFIYFHLLGFIYSFSNSKLFKPLLVRTLIRIVQYLFRFPETYCDFQNSFYAS